MAVVSTTGGETKIMAMDMMDMATVTIIKCRCVMLCVPVIS
jgi:hypothetical protein